jgi:hypothetical protein
VDPKRKEERRAFNEALRTRLGLIAAAQRGVPGQNGPLARVAGAN